MGAYNSEIITVSTDVVTFTKDEYDRGDNNTPFAAVFVVEDADIRFTVDGSTPSATVGLPGEVGDVIEIRSDSDIRAFKAIRSGDTDATIQPEYFNGLA